MHIFYHWSYLVVNFISPVFCFAWFSSAIATHGQTLTLRKCIVKIVTYVRTNFVYFWNIGICNRTKGLYAIVVLFYLLETNHGRSLYKWSHVWNSLH